MTEAVLHRVPAGSILFEQAEIPLFAQFLLAGCVDLAAVDGESESLVETVQPIDLDPLKSLRNPSQNGPAVAVLWRADADSGAIADLIDRVADIQHVESQLGLRRQLLHH